MRGLMNSRAPISGLERPSRASRAICASWAVSWSRRLDGPLASRLAGGQQLARRALGERVSPHRREHVVGRAQLLARVEPPTLAPQPLAVQEVRAAQARRGCGCGRAARSPRGRAARRPRRRSAARASAPRSRAPSRCRPRWSAPRAAEARRRRPRARRSATAASMSSANAQPRRRAPGVLAGLAGRVQRLPVAAEAVVEHCARVRGDESAYPSPPRAASLDAYVDQLGGLGIAAPPGGEYELAVGREVRPGRLRDVSRTSSVNDAAAAELAREDVHADAHASGQREHGERPGIASELDVAVGQHVPDDSSSHRSTAAKLRPARASGAPPPCRRRRRRSALNARRSVGVAGRAPSVMSNRQAVEERGRPRAAAPAPAARRDGPGDLSTGPPWPSRPREHRRATVLPGRSSRASLRSSGSSRLAASSSSGGASLPRLEANAIWARSTLGLGTLDLVERARLRRGEQLQRRFGARRPGAWPAPRRARARPGGAGSSVSSGRALQEGGRRGEAAARLRPAGRALELSGDLLVGPCAAAARDARRGGRDRARDR